jgi:hypothetical protein
MATTTNYGWTTPDNTALLKDGASAIRTLGSSVDTTVKALSPGTTAGDLDYYTSSTAKARLGIGSTGQILTVAAGVPSWAAPAPGGGMTLLSTTTLTGASVTLSSISGSYTDLQLVIRNFKPATDSANIRCQINGDATANRYFSTNTSTSDNGNTALTFNADYMLIHPTNDNSVANGLAVVNFYDYTNTATWKIVDFKGISTDPTTTTSFRMLNGNAAYNQTSAITSLVLFPNSGNFTSGTALLYGVK